MLTYCIYRIFIAKREFRRNMGRHNLGLAAPNYRFYTIFSLGLYALIAPCYVFFANLICRLLLGQGIVYMRNHMPWTYYRIGVDISILFVTNLFLGYSLEPRF